MRNAPGTLPAEVWPAPRRDSAPPQTQTQAAPLAPPIVVAVPAPPPPPVVMTIPAIGQAQAAQPPAPVDQPRVTTQQPPAPVEEAVARTPAADATAAILPVKIDTRVSVRANSWVELRAPNGDVLAETYLRAGESYVVPAGIAYRLIDAR